jgi:hypothetical protein
VPRPVGIISATERVHDSAWGRSSAHPPLVPAHDVYKEKSRRDWLATIGPRPGRCSLEEVIAKLPRPADPPPVDIPRTLGVCGAILAFINPQG